MGFDLEERPRKSFLYADLFKQGEINSVIMSPPRRRSPSSSAASDSSSSGFTTPFSSELDSSESDDADFAAELSRQMAECMLREEDDDRQPNPCIKLKNQSAAGDRAGVSSGGRVKGAELTQRMQTRKTERSYGRNGSGRMGQTGSGMRAIFLAGPGSKTGSSGTGVFLPQLTKNPVERRKKSGLSTVLIPTRVLEALELHFTRLPDSASGSSRHASPRDERMRWKGQENAHTKFKEEAVKKVDDMQILPQEWTY